MQAQRPLPVGTSGESELKMKLSRALLHFQDRLLEGNITPGSLCQVQLRAQLILGVPAHRPSCLQLSLSYAYVSGCVLFID